MLFSKCQQRQRIVLFIMILAQNCGAENSVNRFVTTPNFGLTTSFKTVTSSYKVRCCGACAADGKCLSATYWVSTSQCQMCELPLVAITASRNLNNNAVYYSLDDWLLVFRATPGIGEDAQIAWLNGIGVTTSDVTCQELSVTSCAQHYRYPVVDSWNVLGLKQVKLVFYKGQQEKYVIFNGIDSDISNWFQQTRVLDSLWPGLESEQLQFFSIEGNFERHFITTFPYDTCETDVFYTLILEGMTAGNRCYYENRTSYPQFFFATGDGPGYTDVMLEMDLADVFAIFIKKNHRRMMNSTCSHSTEETREVYDRRLRRRQNCVRTNVKLVEIK